MKKLIITEEEKKLIINKYYSGLEINEQKVLKNLFSKTFNGIFKNFSDDAVKSFDDLFIKAIKPGNTIEQKGKLYLISMNSETPPIPLEYVEELLLNVANGRLRREEVLKYFPSKLADGKTDFRMVMDDLLKKKKPNNANIIPKNTVKTLSPIEKKYIFKGCKSHTDCPQYNSIRNEFINKLPKSNTKFAPEQVKVVEGPFTDPVGREIIVVKMPNGEEIIWNSSSGSNVLTTGKEKGTWSVIPGFAENGWFIKTPELVKLTRGGNQYLTDMATFLEKNGVNRLGDVAFKF
jgi:hypothetical protein